MQRISAVLAFGFWQRKPALPTLAPLWPAAGLFLLVLILLLALTPASTAHAQAKEIASYQISVKLDTDQKLLSGSERISFLNDTANPVGDLYLHLYPNAFRGIDSTFMRENPEEARRSVAENNWGYMDLSVLRLASGQDLLAAATLDDTVLHVPLPAPLSPGETLQMETQFTVKLPRLIARMGYQGDQYTIAQWFPKLAVLTDSGWNAHQYHANSEFFADFGSYRVEITLPDRFVVGATGLPAGERENGDGTKTLTFQANSVHDFAWVANPQFREAWARAGNTDIRLLYPPEHDGVKQRFLDAAVAALENFGRWYGPYPYARLTVADVPERAGAGMEYPTLVTVSQEVPSSLGVLDIEQVTIHEIGHQWWYGMVATNEFEEAWMDEGFTTYSTRKLSDQMYGADRSMGDVLGLR
ncbi:MAG TPA: M1 family metallopeptidase, partial [Chloroflexota bacterium]|nr:M1 family metallopeptidase [Chloroflexota bacterium]